MNRLSLNRARKGGFTLIEIMVVLVVIAIVSSITFGAFQSVSAGNKKTNCQSNLSQIYQATRLYAQDYNGQFPYLNTGGASNGLNTPLGGIGLWSLYTYRKANDNNCTTPEYQADLPAAEAETSAPSLAGYIRSPRIFHCPADNYLRSVEYRATSSATSCSTLNVNSGELTFVPPSPAVQERRLNPLYLSYQSIDDIADTATPQDTYATFRKSGEKRQLTYYITDSSSVNQTPARPTEGNAVVAWCRFHRRLKQDNTGSLTTVATSRTFDNVLFYDGSVQYIPAHQDINTTQACDALSATCVGGWQRVPKKTP